MHISANVLFTLKPAAVHTEPLQPVATAMATDHHAWKYVNLMRVYA